MEKVNLCKCNNCGTIMLDENPQVNAPKFEAPEKTVGMKYINEPADKHSLSGGNYFWGCPVCMTDAYLKDIETVEDLK